MTAAERRAVELHAKRLKRQAIDADRQYRQLRAAFPTYLMGRDDGLIAVAARHADDTRSSARDFADRLAFTARRA